MLIKHNGPNGNAQSWFWQPQNKTLLFLCCCVRAAAICLVHENEVHRRHDVVVDRRVACRKGRISEATSMAVEVVVER